MKKYKLSVITVVLSILVSLFWFNQIIYSPEIAHENDEWTLAELAYTNDKSKGVVYLYENERLEPYFVLTDNYLNQGYVLLLRKYIIPLTISFQIKDNSPSYEFSNVDNFLTKEFPGYFHQDFRDSVPAITLLNQDLKEFHRQFFVLTASDIKGEQALNFFEEESRFGRTAFGRDGDTYNWWIRSDNPNNLQTIDSLGLLSLNNDYDSLNAVRPAFTLSADALVVRELRYGEEFYLIPAEWENVWEVQQKN